MSARHDVHDTQLPVLQDADDIRSLIQHLNLGELEYMDIASIRAWQQGIERWPLLAEWNEWSAEAQK